MAGIRLGVFGGSFDPPHAAHVMVALWALLSGEVDRILVIPVARHPFGKQQGAGFGDRMEMCRLAFGPLGSAVEISPIESQREGTSFMIDTLEGLAKERPDARFRLVVGSDIVREIDAWRESGRIRQMAPLLVVPRNGGNRPYIPHGLPDISSTHVREHLAAHEDVSLLVPHSVRQYINTRRLYAPQEGPQS